MKKLNYIFSLSTCNCYKLSPKLCTLGYICTMILQTPTVDPINWKFNPKPTLTLYNVGESPEEYDTDGLNVH